MGKKKNLARMVIHLECTESRNLDVPGVSRYTTKKNKKNTPKRLELMKYNKFLRRHTLHREVKSPQRLLVCRAGPGLPGSALLLSVPENGCADGTHGGRRRNEKTPLGALASGVSVSLCSAGADYRFWE